MGRGGFGGGAFGAGMPGQAEARVGLSGPPTGRRAVAAAKEVQSMRAAPAASAVVAHAPTMRTAGGKTFYFDPASGYWVDSDYETGGRQARLKYLGKGYVELVARSPEVARWLAVGERVRLRVGGINLSIAPDLEDSLAEDQIDSLVP